MSQPSSRNLSHDFPAWKGLSLRELFWIVITTTPLTSFFFILAGIILGFPLASGCVGFLLGFILAITFWPKRIARIKEGKPYGFVTKQAILCMVRLKIKHSPWFYYKGRWQKNKTIGAPHV
ncbi:TIGR03750 family conjugal transfer protein [Legionella septentrionalis]|uniref:TIGR03750 family conjugal transfer protein n=1 Tax=Legionella septentrionalis TaxID=2498109 RepID=A0A3S1CL28_9GAMM|nr:TIGR03750 family conjugal transfer protein [Legionella septentrionalis]RUQ85136.1 TIGR03750 family conjugal transfer protein [Legionella septentrionalis]